ncbi:MAG: DUF3466 family protein [Methylobacter sp.]|nr:DUF3466 family protein [Methylobacter sp.]
MTFKITSLFSSSYFILMLGFLALTSVSQASTYTYRDFDFPHTPATPTEPGNPYGYSGSSVTDINDKGQVIGGYYAYHKSPNFFYDGRAYTELPDHPLAVPILYSPNTFPASINNNGQIVGSYTDCYAYSEGLCGPYDVRRNRSFVYDTATSTYTTLNDPYLPYSNYATGINNNGDIVGGYRDSTGGHGFLYHEGIFTTLNDPNAPDATVLTDINDKGQIVGTYRDSTGFHSFLYDGGSYTTLNNPNAPNAYFADINNSGQMVGTYRDSTGTHGFLYDGSTYIALNDPNATNGTFASGINNKGQIVGSYGVIGDPNGIESHGFIATPSAVPIPAAVWLFCSALIGFSGISYRKIVKVMG